MKKEEIIELAHEWLESVPDIKKDIKFIESEINKYSFDKEYIDTIKKRRVRLQAKLSKVIRAISVLKDEEQRIICYRYFDKLSYKIVGAMVGYSHRTIARRIEKSKLTIGRIMFGFEDEFFEALEDLEEYSI